MEVFPLEDAAGGEMGGSSVSQVEQMKTWDASFAQLEKMLQAACETEVAEPNENNFSSTLPSTLSPLTSHSSNSNEDNKRKRSDSGSLDVESKHFRSNDMLPDFTLKEAKSPENITSDNSPKLSDINEIEKEIQNETTSYKQLEETDNNFQHGSKLLEENNSVVGAVFESVSSTDEQNKDENETCVNTSESLTLPSFSFTHFNETDDILANSEKETLNNENIVSKIFQEDISNIEPSLSLPNDNADVTATNTADCENDNNHSPFPTKEFEPKVIKSETNKPSENSEKDPDTTNVISTEKKEKKDKEEHVDKNGKKDDKLLKKKKFERCNIRDIKLEDELDAVTLSAQKEEQERIKRLQEAQMRALQERLQIIEVEKEALSQLFSQPDASEPNLFNSTPDNESSESNDMDDKSKIPVIKSETDVILLESSDEDKKVKLEEILPAPPASEENVIDISSSSSDGAGSESDDDSDKKDDDVLVLSDEGEPEPGPEDPNNSGAHTNDCFNLVDLEGRVLVNVGHPPEDPDIYLAPQIAKVIKPHQIGGIRFLYDNVVENLERYKSSTGFGCILAHSMGLGKTVQVVSFVDVFLRHTPATLVLCIVPINTIQNWKAEFDMWVPATNSVDDEQIDSGEIRPRDYNVYTLNENFKTMSARSSLIAEWRLDGGVLLMGYEMYRMLALRKMPKIPVKKGRRMKKQEVQVEPETCDQIKKFMDQMYEHIVIPGPDLVICDEGHRIKNSLASTSMALKSIKTRRRVVLTGYPLQNNLLEYWCMVDFVRPNYLGSRAEFCNMFERPISNGQCIDSTPRDRQLMRFRSHVLHSLLVGFVQRRGHSVLRAVLPKKEEHVLLIRMTTIQRQLYKCFVKDLLYVQQATNPLKLFAVCCKIWNHPDILYKLLQEKKAQEDIDLDIDLSAPGSSAGSSVATMKKKASNKDLMKGKHFQRSLKALPIKQEVGLNVQKTESSALCQMPAMINVKKEIESTENIQPSIPQDSASYADLSSQICKDDYPLMHSNVQPKSSNLGYTQSFTQSQYTQQSPSFCQSSYSQQSGMQPLSASATNSVPYPSQYPSQLQHQGSTFGSTSVSQQPYPSKGVFSPGANTQQFPQQAATSSQAVAQPNQQQYNISSSTDQGFPSQALNSDGYHNMSQFPSQNSAQPFSQTTLQTQQYSQNFSQQKQPSSKPHRQYKQDVNTQQFSMQQSPQAMNSQIPFNQHSQSNQPQFDPTVSISQYPSPSQQFTSGSQPPTQFNQQSLHSPGQHMPYSEKHSYAEQPADGQLCHDQPLGQQSYSDHTLQQQFNQPAQQKFCQSPAPPSQFTSRSQSSQQQFSQTTSLDPPAFSQLSPNSKLHQQSSPQQHFPQQPSPQFSQQMSPLQQFSQCSPSQSSYSQKSPSQPPYTQQSPPLQQSPTQQQYSLPSPTHQPYSQGFPQSSSNHQQFGQQQHQYPQESSPQLYSQPQFGHQSASQYPQHSSPQTQQFTHQTNKQSYGQQFIPPNTQYPRQTSPQQHFSQVRQSQFGIGHQQKFPHQSMAQYKSHSGTSYPQQGNHSQFSPVSSQPSSQSQSFTAPPSPTSSSMNYNQQTQGSLRQQYNSDQYGLQAQPNKSQTGYNQATTQNISSAQYAQSPGKSQFQSSQPSVSPSFIQPQSPSSQNYSLSTQGTCHQGLSAKQYQHSFPTTNQQNSQSSFPLHYPPQVQSCMQPPSQIPSNTHQNNSKQLPVKGSTKTTMTQGSEHVVESTTFLPQAFQGTGLDVGINQQITNSNSNANSNFHAMQSSTVKQENFVADSLKEETDITSSGSCHKTGKTQPNTISNLMPHQQGQINKNPDGIKCENDSINNFSQDCVTPVRERMDSSINYEWAISIMKEYVLGVLENSHKMMVLFSIIEKTIRKGDKLLVFSQSLSTLDLLEHFLGKVKIPLSTSTEENITEFWCRNKNYFRLDGSTSAQEREKLINEFNKNESVSLFLLSTRAGCLGINLVGANRIVVMDASWNPCHDAQAVCRIYRYGQKKPCHIYRLVTDNSLEKRIYDRQVNKQGMSDRVVDELNPESNFTWKDVTTLIQDDEDDGPAQELTQFETSYTDDVLKHLVTSMSQSLSKEPFEHESLLLDRKDLKLTKQEKKLAKQSYEMAKRANMINIRTTYTYMPGGGGQFIINNKQCQWVGGTTVRVLPGQVGRGTTNRAGTTATPITASPSLMNTLFKQGVMVQKLTIPSTISIPVLTPGAPPVVVPAGQDVLVLRTPKGVYLRLPDGRIIAVQLPPSLLAKTQFRPNVVTHFRPSLKGNNQTGTGRGQSIGIIKQTLQCGGTVRYLGPKNAAANSAQNAARSSAPEVIELSDDDEPSGKKNNMDEDNSDFESESVEKDRSTNIMNKTNIFQGKQITIRRVSPAMQQNTIQMQNSKEKSDLPLKLQQNQQITIMPINTTAQQARQKPPPPLAQPVRVQQMLLQPQQGKRKPVAKSTTKIQLSSLSANKNFQKQQITVTPALPIQQQKYRVSNSVSPFQKTFDSVNSPSNKTAEMHISATKSDSPSPISITETSKRMEMSIQAVDRNSDLKAEGTDISSSISLPNLNLNPLVKASEILNASSLSVASSAPETIKSSFNSLSEISHHLSSFMNQNLSLNSNNSPTPSGSAVQVLPLSVSQNLPPSLSVTPIPQTNPGPATHAAQAEELSSSFFALNSHHTNLQLQTSSISNSQGQDQASISSASISQNSGELQITPLVNKSSSENEKNENDDVSKSFPVPKHSNSNSRLTTNLDANEATGEVKTMQSSYTIENGQLQHDMSYAQEPLTHMQHTSGHQSPIAMSTMQSQQQVSSKKKKASRQTSKKPPLVTQLAAQTSQATPQISDSIHQFSHSSLSEHLHDPHRFQPFSHSLQNSDFQPFQGYAVHKPLLHIQHPQPLHPLQHSQEHSLASHLTHMSPLYPMAAHIPGNSPSLSDIQPQPPQAWPVPQSSISSFHPFGQSSQYYNSHENNQFSFQPSSFALSQPASTHISQSEPDVSMTGLEHVSNSLSSEL